MLVSVVYVVRVIAPGWRSGFPSFFPDSASYTAVSRMGPFDPAFWFADRPFGVPLTLWLSGGNDRAFFLIQTLLFVLALAHLSSVLLKVIAPRWLAWIAVAAVTSISIHPRFALWHLEILSESLALTLSMFLFASWLRFADSPDRRHLGIGIAATIAWMSVRDVHIVVGFVIALVLLAWIAVRRKHPLRRSVIIGSATLVAFCSYVLVAQSASDRNLYPLINNVGERVLPNEDITETFAKNGMPIDDVLLERTGADSWSDDEKFLRSSELANFRSWADSRGQRALLTSLVVDAPFWIDTTRTAVDATLPLDFTEYDRHSVSERLPTRLFWFQGPRTSTHLAIWLALGFAALAMLFASVAKNRKAASDSLRFGVVGTVALTAAFLDVYMSASGDSVEVQRHLLGPIFRLTLILVVIVALGSRAAVGLLRRPRETADTPRPERIPVSRSAALAVSLGAVGIFGSWVALEHRSQDFDPQYARTIVERAARFGGTYYQNAVHNKGPLETVVYDSARLFTSFDTYWFGISAFVVAIAVVLGLTARTIARSLDDRPTPVFSVTAGALVTSHFALSDADYAGVLYSRNITTAILAVVVAVTIWDRPWRSRIAAQCTYVALFALLGLAIQTLLTTVFAASVIGAFVHLRRSTSTGLRLPLLAALTTVAGSIATAPLWYALRGSFDEFWSNWWTYAGYMSSSTGRSLLDQIGLGAQKSFGYYQERPGVALLIVAFAFFARLRWRHLPTAARTLIAILAAWLFAGWIELTLSQRYSSHYFSVVAVPTALIAVVTAVLAAQSLSSGANRWQNGSAPTKQRSAWMTSIICIVALLAAQGTHLTWIAIEGAGGFRNTAHYAQARANMRSGSQETRQAVLDLVTSPDDPLLAWTMYPWTYLDHRRVPATRFSWKSFLIGEIYLGRTSSQYVLDRTWEWFDEDLAESRPLIYARPQVTDLEPRTPFQDVVENEFAIVYADEELELGWKQELWDIATAPTNSQMTIGRLAPGWTSDPTSRVLTADAGADALPLNFEQCRRLTTRLTRASTADPTGIAFTFLPLNPSEEPVSLNVDFERAWSMRENQVGVSSPTELHATVLSATNRRSLDITLVVTAYAAALIVDGAIVSAVPLPATSSVTLSPTVDTTTMSIPTIGELEGFAGC